MPFFASLRTAVFACLAVGAGLAAGAPMAAAQTPAPKAAPGPATAPRVEPAPPTVDRVNAYFNSLKGLQADFIQLSPDGRRFGGILYLQRPGGKLRFEYHPPAALQIISDGTSVAVLDKKLKEQSEYFVGQTPLKFLTQPRVDVAKDSKVTDLKRVGADIVLSLEDRNTLAGTSRIKVVFDGTSHVLKEWTVTDPQGHDTRVMLTNLNPNATPDKSLFVIERQNLQRAN